MSEHRSYKAADVGEALQFRAIWCFNCRSAIGCSIRLRAENYDSTDSEFPGEWRIGDAGPECTAFEPKRRRFG